MKRVGRKPGSVVGSHSSGMRVAAQLAAQITEVRHNEVYKRALELKQAYGAR